MKADATPIPTASSTDRSTANPHGVRSIDPQAGGRMIKSSADVANLVAAGTAHATLAAALIGRANKTGDESVAAMGYAHADAARQWLDEAAQMRLPSHAPPTRIDAA